MLRIQPLHFLRVQFHLHLRQLLFEYLHSLFGIGADAADIIAVTLIEHIERRDALVDMVQHHIGQPRSNGTALLQGAVLRVNGLVNGDIDVAVIILSQHINQSRLAVTLLDGIKGSIDILDRHAVEVLAKVSLPAYEAIAVGLGIADSPTDFLHDPATADTLLIRRAAGMDHVGHQLKQQVVGDRAHHPVVRLVDTHLAIRAVILGDKGDMRRGNLIVASHDSVIHADALLGLAQLIEAGLADTLDAALFYCVLPPCRVEEHSEDFVLTSYIFLHTSYFVSGCQTAGIALYFFDDTICGSHRLSPEALMKAMH